MLESPNELATQLLIAGFRNLFQSSQLQNMNFLSVFFIFVITGPSSKDVEEQFHQNLWKNLSQKWDELSKEDEYDKWLDEFGDFSNNYKVSGIPD